MSANAQKNGSQDGNSKTTPPAKYTRYPWNFILSSNKEVKYMLINIAVILGLIIISNVFSFYILTNRVTADLTGSLGSVQSDSFTTISLGTFSLFIVTSALIYLTTLNLAFRFAGPLIAMSKHVDELLNGNFEHRIHLRKNDPLAPIGQKLNNLAERMAGISSKKL